MLKTCELPECNKEFEPRRSGRPQKYCSDLHGKRNPETVRRQVKAYQATDIGYSKHRAKTSRQTAARRGAVIDPTFKDAILADIFFNTLACNHCGTEHDLHDLFIDHKLAIVNGGQHTESNISILCETCHNIKTVIDSHTAWDARARAA